LRLWTIKSLAYWEKCQEVGVIKCDGRKLGEPLFKTGYDWMRGQMKKRIPGCKGKFPIWAWIERPDLRTTGSYVRDSPGVCIEIEVPDHLVLLSDFDGWHCVLNGCYTSLSEKDDNEFDNKFKSPKDFGITPAMVLENPGLLTTHKAYQAEEARMYQAITDSWDRIFNLGLMRKNDLFFPPGGNFGQNVQACVEVIPIEWVKAVRHMKVRPAKDF